MKRIIYSIILIIVSFFVFQYYSFNKTKELCYIYSDSIDKYQTDLFSMQLAYDNYTTSTPTIQKFTEFINSKFPNQAILEGLNNILVKNLVMGVDTADGLVEVNCWLFKKGDLENAFDTLWLSEMNFSDYLLRKPTLLGGVFLGSCSCKRNYLSIVKDSIYIHDDRLYSKIIHDLILIVDNDSSSANKIPKRVCCHVFYDKEWRLEVELNNVVDETVKMELINLFNTVEEKYRLYDFYIRINI